MAARAATAGSTEEANMQLFRAPLHSGMRKLDRSKFQRSVPLKAARIFDNKNISRIRGELERSKDALRQERIDNVTWDPDPDRRKSGQKCLLLRPDVNAASGKAESNGQPLLSPPVAELVKQGLISIIPYDLKLDYEYWTYHDIMVAILPEDEQGEIPSGFSVVGHVAHLNLRAQYLPYKSLFAEILMDKNPQIRTVINKIDDVGEESEYRTFKYELLAGPDDMNVTISEGNCTFKCDYSKVYWNTRLQTEHRRLVELFNEGEAVCDVMAGIGPFAVPAGKKRIFVWANDLNPHSWTSLQDAIHRNKVERFVKPFNEDGHTFIRTAAARLATEEQAVEIRSQKKESRHSKTPSVPNPVKILHQPKTFQHFVLNLPATAITFLSNFVGLYPSSIRQHLPDDFAMPLIHVYCFSTKSDDNSEQIIDICDRISEQLGHKMHAASIDLDGGVQVYDVRDVAPNKRMFCASFRLPKEVAFRET